MALSRSLIAAAFAALVALAPGAAGAGPLLDKALAYSANHHERHAPGPYHCSVAVRYVAPGSDEVLRYEKQGDSTIWTGNYLAGESYRYAVTGDPDAKANALDAVECLLAMQEVNGKPGFISRYVGLAEPPDLTGECLPERDCHVVTEGPYAGTYWRGNTSSDQYLGWWYGLSHAYRMVLDAPGDEPVRARIRDAMAQAIDTLRAEGYLITDPDGTVSTAGPEIRGNEALAFHLVAAEIVGGAYAAIMPTVYAEQFVAYWLTTIYPISRWFQYYAFHLGHMAQHMVLQFEKDPILLKLHRNMHRIRLYNEVRGTQQVMFDYIAFGTGSVPADPAVLAEDKDALAVIQPPPNLEVHPVQGPFEFDPRIDELNEIIVFLEELLGIDIGTRSPQALQPFPPAERCVGRFRWQISPYDICGASDPALEISGQDYLVAYWMGRYYGFLTETD